MTRIERIVGTARPAGRPRWALPVLALASLVGVASVALAGPPDEVEAVEETPANRWVSDEGVVIELETGPDGELRDRNGHQVVFLHAEEGAVPGEHEPVVIQLDGDGTWTAEDAEQVLHVEGLELAEGERVFVIHADPEPSQASPSK